jgi:hypothetical protein
MFFLSILLDTFIEERGLFVFGCRLPFRVLLFGIGQPLYRDNEKLEHS